jgi:hypothetical protein
VIWPVVAILALAAVIDQSYTVAAVLALVALFKMAVTT